jgi:dTDP-4-dehydrorhamnose reductase
VTRNTWKKPFEINPVGQERMKIIITGGSGILGGYLVETAPARFQITATYHSNLPRSEGCGFAWLDITDASAVDGLFREIKPEAVIHTAGAANVDFCQKNQEQGYSNNVTGTGNIISACRAGNIRLIHLSTNAVYGGDAPPYGEESPMEPVNIYGQQKKESDNLVRKSGLDWTIVRPILMYGWSRPWSRKDFVVWVLENLKAGKPVKLVDDVSENPLSAEVCAQAIWGCLEKRMAGEFNLAGKDVVNRYQLGLTAAKVFGHDPGLIEPVKNESFKNIAPRPANTSFNALKMASVLGLEPQPLEEGLRRMMDSRPSSMDMLTKGRLAK